MNVNNLAAYIYTGQWAADERFDENIVSSDE